MNVGYENIVGNCIKCSYNRIDLKGYMSMVKNSMEMNTKDSVNRVTVI